jgi:hypothetical protein
METRPRCLPHRPASRVPFLSLALGLTLLAISATAGPPPPPGGHIPIYLGGANQAGYPPGTTDVAGSSAPVVPLQDLSSAPNPFSGETTVGFTLGLGSEARLRIFDLAGRQVREFVQRASVAGRQRVHWDGRDEAGNRLASGIYFYQVQSGKVTVTKKLVLMR